MREHTDAEHEYPIHEGPMAQQGDPGWREDAARLEALAQKRIENPMQTLPNSLTSIDKSHAARAMSDEGTVEQNENARGADRTER